MINSYLEEFCASWSFKNLIKELACFKNPENTTHNDHILQNHPQRLRWSGVCETGLSAFYKLTLTTLKVFHAERKLKIIQYRDLNRFCKCIIQSRSSTGFVSSKCLPGEFEKFAYVSSKVLNFNVPIKQKHGTSLFSRIKKSKKQL